MKCTWEHCKNEAVKPQVGSNGRTWANLCGDHDIELDRAHAVGFKKLISCWVKAQGGAKKAAESM